MNNALSKITRRAAIAAAALALPAAQAQQTLKGGTSTPVLMPLVNQAGIDPVYFGVLFVINNAIGLITPRRWAPS